MSDMDAMMDEQLRATYRRGGGRVSAHTPAPVHHTATVDRPWDAGTHMGRMPSPMPVGMANRMFGWVDGSQAENGRVPKAACKLPHHEVSADGSPGAANLAGVRNALARLSQSDIPASDMAAVRRHLEAHMNDARSSE